MFNLSVADGFKVNAHWKIFYACPSLSQTTCTPAETSIYRMICAQNGTSNRKYILQTLRPEVNMDILVVFENNVITIQLRSLRIIAIERRRLEQLLSGIVT